MENDDCDDDNVSPLSVYVFVCMSICVNQTLVAKYMYVALQYINNTCVFMHFIYLPDSLRKKELVSYKVAKLYRQNLANNNNKSYKLNFF